MVGYMAAASWLPGLHHLYFVLELDSFENRPCLPIHIDELPMLYSGCQPCKTL